MRIGYACLTVGVADTELRTCTQKTATAEKLTELIDHNLSALARMIEYNVKSGIPMLRISSDIIPFGSSPVNQLAWTELFADHFQQLGQLAQEGDIRLSMHPGQYTVINSPSGEVVERAVEDLRYHTCFLDALGLGPEHKIILHIGGAYGDKEAAMARFCTNYRQLDEAIKARLVIENDDKIYTIEEVVQIGEAESIPVVFDNLHYQVNQQAGSANEAYWIERCRATWKETDGNQKIHYSQQAEGKRAGSHSRTIDGSVLTEFVTAAGRPDLDIMLEVKDKNLSAVKGIYCLKEAGLLAEPRRIKDLEQEWSRYKYTVLEHSPQAYQEIRQLLKDKESYPAREFYRLVDGALGQEISTGQGVNALQHVWGYFKSRATSAEESSFFKALAGYEQGKRSLKAAKSLLRRLAVKYQEEYLLQSYYFTLE